MCLALLRLDFAAAWQANKAILLLAPAGAVIAVRIARRYINTGSGQPTRGEARVLYGMIALLILFGILRNLPGFSYLQPV